MAWKLAVFSWSCFLLALLQAIGVTFAYKPVIIIHGLLDSASDMVDMKEFIQKAHPGTEVHAIDLYDDYQSFDSMWLQVDGIRNATLPIMKSAKDGVHMIGYSQGGLVVRGIIQTTDRHNVDSFIALSSPLNGQYGNTFLFKRLFPHYLKEDLYLLFYTAYGQKWSIANYWRDPHEFARYQIYSDFLAHLNNESMQEKNNFRESWRTNFARLGKLVLIGGPSDDVIAPWQSAQFGFYDENERVILMRNRKIYREDVFGLSTLDKAKSLLDCTVPGIKHLEWHKDPAVFQKCIEPFLT